MKMLFFTSALLVAAAAIATPAQAQNYPWCAQYGNGTGGARNCGFSSFQQCQADVSGIGGFCERNNTYVGAATVRRHRKRS
jgi:Protein of unknown function (DUF3551)